MLRTSVTARAGLVFGAIIGFFAVHAAFAQVHPNPHPGGGGSIQFCELNVVGVEKRSSCDLPEWWVEVTNTSQSVYYRVSIHARTLASYGTEPQCVEDVEQTFELAPGQCNHLTSPFYNGPGRPCDDPCCILPPAERTGECLLCTKILDAEVRVLAYKLTPTDSWINAPGSPSVCVIQNGAAFPPGCSSCQVINTCLTQDWNLPLCGGGDPEQ